MALEKFQPYLFVSAGEQSNKYLTPTITNGIAQFQAQRVQSLTGLTVRIDPIQEGTGDPSPTNIRPISGRTGMTVTAAGKNLWKFDASYSPTGYKILVNKQPLYLPVGTYTFSAIPNILSDNIVLFGYHADGTRTEIVRLSHSTSRQSASCTIAKPVVSALFVSNNGGTISDIQLEVGSTATAYEPYVGQTYPITWESIAGTVYGGTLDAVSGMLTVDWDYIASYDGETLPGEWISDRDVYAEGTTPTTGAEVAYKIAEPVTYQLDPEQIMIVPGFNQVYADAGPVIDIKF